MKVPRGVGRVAYHSAAVGGAVKMRASLKTRGPGPQKRISIFRTLSRRDASSRHHLDGSDAAGPAVGSEINPHIV